ncbi:ABC transporter ATP-binding protein [Devosia sp. A369]
MMAAMSDLLKIENLTCAFEGQDRTVFAVNQMALEVNPGEIVAIVGESGCGKSATAMAIMGLLPPTARVSGSIRFNGRELLNMSSRDWRSVRGGEIGMIFQDPMTALNPMMTIGDQIAEVLNQHKKLSRAAVREAVISLLDRVRIPSPAKRYAEFPHQLSGGMRQRVVIAMAIACRPKLIIADEPTTALDVTIQAQILALLDELRREVGSAIVLISHDLGVVSEVADRVVVMYAGSVVETAPTSDLMAGPRHRYASRLISAAPDIDRVLNSSDGSKPALEEIPGVVPQLLAPPTACVFRERCTASIERCATENPDLLPVSERHSVACWNPVMGEQRQ